MNSNKELWEKGDFSKLAATVRGSSDALVDELGITPGMKVLDLASGDGATALPMAWQGAEVLGIDIVRNMVTAARARYPAGGWRKDALSRATVATCRTCPTTAST